MERIELVAVEKSDGTVPIVEREISQELERIRMVLELQNVIIMIAGNVVHGHSLLEETNLIQRVPVFKENTRRVSSPHVDHVAEQYQVRDIRLVLKFLKKTVERLLIGVLIP